MDSEARAIIRSLELQNEAKAQDVSNAYQMIARLEDEAKDAESKIQELETQVGELTDQSTNLAETVASLNEQIGGLENPVNTNLETQIDFINKVAESQSKFAKEAQDIIDEIDVSVVDDPVIEESNE